MSIFNFFRRNRRPNLDALAGLFSGGNGDSYTTAVVVRTEDSFVGVQAEYVYIASQCGEREKDWTLQSQRLGNQDGRIFDVLTITLSSGEVRTFYFDIGHFYGK